jgi:4-amino-4-deoxy-L-arabinose transferase-like glycosyltransferase
MGRHLRTGALLAGVLGIAAALRFAGLGHHLAHDPMDFDEMNNFVEPILRMWRTGSPDPTVYSGYPGFFNWLAFLPVLAGQRLAGAHGAYVGGRALVAGFGVANVWLTYKVCRAFVGPGPALLGAALMAVSRGPVRAAHAITPDVLVATATLGLLLVVQRAAAKREWVGAGILCGLATAVKYTGLLTLPILVVGLWLRPERRRSLPTAILAALLTFGAAAPYAVVAQSPMGAGFEHSVRHYYGGATDENRALQGRGGALEDVVHYFVLDVTYAGLALALLALVLHRPRRELFPALALVAATILATAPANKVYSRHMLSATAAAIVLAAIGFDALVARFPASPRRDLAASLVAGLVLVLPAREAAWMAWTYRGPTAADQAVAWVEANLPGPRLIASAADPFEPDRARFEVRAPVPIFDLPPDVRAHYDALVASGPVPKGHPDLETATEICTGPRGVACEFTILLPRARPVLTPAAPPSAVEGSAEDGRAAVDGDAATVWLAPAGPTSLVLRWNEPQPVVRVDVDVDARESSWPQEITWDGIAEEGDEHPLAAETLRPARARRQMPTSPHGQAYVFTAPAPLRELRLFRANGDAWGIAEIRILCRR